MWPQPQARQVQSQACQGPLHAPLGDFRISQPLLRLPRGFSFPLLLFPYFLFIKGKGRSGSMKASGKICKLPVGSLGEIGLAKPEEGLGGDWKHKGNKIK